MPGGGRGELAGGREGRGREGALAGKTAEAVACGRLGRGVLGACIVGGLAVAEEVGVRSRRGRGGLFAGATEGGLRHGERGVDCLERSHVCWRWSSPNVGIGGGVVVVVVAAESPGECVRCGSRPATCSGCGGRGPLGRWLARLDGEDGTIAEPHEVRPCAGGPRFASEEAGDGADDESGTAVWHWQPGRRASGSAGWGAQAAEVLVSACAGRKGQRGRRAWWWWWQQQTPEVVVVVRAPRGGCGESSGQ